MNAHTLRRIAYGLSALLGLAYAGYVLAAKWAASASGGALGDVGEFLLVLACVTAFCVGLFADEAARGARSG
jgi:hypothetical protein